MSKFDAPPLLKTETAKGLSDLIKAFASHLEDSTKRGESDRSRENERSEADDGRDDERSDRAQSGRAQRGLTRGTQRR